MAIPLFYDLEEVEQIAVNLFHGWGYNFYRVENQLRADDLMIRRKVGWLLGVARGGIEAAESAFRRKFLPVPTREKPSHDAAALADAQTLERLSQSIGALEGKIRAAPVPENDRMTELYRQEAATLRRLIDGDRRLAGQAEILRKMLDGKDGAWLVANATDIEEGIRAIDGSLKERQAALFG